MNIYLLAPGGLFAGESAAQAIEAAFQDWMEGNGYPAEDVADFRSDFEREHLRQVRNLGHLENPKTVAAYVAALETEE